MVLETIEIMKSGVNDLELMNDIIPSHLSQALYTIVDNFYVRFTYLLVHTLNYSSPVIGIFMYSAYQFDNCHRPKRVTFVRTWMNLFCDSVVRFSYCIKMYRTILEKIDNDILLIVFVPEYIIIENYEQ